MISDNTNKIVATIPVGKNPCGLAYDDSKGEIFVTGFIDSTVSVISDSSNSVVATVQLVGVGGSSRCGL